jgi:hypothetical protein
MNMMKLLTKIGDIAKWFVFGVGLVTIMKYCDERWPSAFSVVTVLLFIIAGISYCQRYLFTPFFEGLRNSK